MSTDPMEAVGRLEGLVGRLLGAPSASDIFGPPTTAGDTVVIPAAAFERAGGFGFGAGEGQDHSSGGGGGVGGGGGGTTEGRPVAVIEVGPAGVRIHRIVDATRITIAVVAALIALRRIARKKR